MMIELARYNETRGLLRDWGHRVMGRHTLWDGGWRASVTMVAVHMGKKQMGM